MVRGSALRGRSRLRRALPIVSGCRADHGEQTLVGRHGRLEAIGCEIGKRGAWVSRTGLVEICEWTFDWSSIENLG